MAKNLRTAMALLRDNDCYRFGNDLVVKSSKRVAHSDVQMLIDRGYAVMAGDNNIVITEKGGFVNRRNTLCYRTRRSAVDFLQKHDVLTLRQGYFVASNGKRLSAYAAQHLIDQGLLVETSVGVYCAASKVLRVPGDIYPAVKAFVEMLERARDRRDI